MKPVEPIVKNMLNAYPARRIIFITERFNHKELENNINLSDEVMRAFGDINYDEKLKNKPEYDEYL